MKVFSENKQLRNSDNYDKSKLIIVSVSVQPILSLAIRYNLSVKECASKLAGYLKRLGADYVIDMTVADDLALLESQREFVQRFRSAEIDSKKNTIPMLASSCPGNMSIYAPTVIAIFRNIFKLLGFQVGFVMQRRHMGISYYHLYRLPSLHNK